MANPIPEQIIRRVKETANIVDVAAESVVLKKAGRNYVGLCPFHAEKTPSFTVSEEKQIFYCFGCHEGGGVFNLLMLLDGLSFPEAVRRVAEKYSIEIPQEGVSPHIKMKLAEKERVFQTNEIARQFFCSMLKDPRIGQKAMAYLTDRGITHKIIDNFSLGFAPDTWDALLKRSQEKRQSAQWLEKCGLAVANQKRNGHYDRFRNRVIFPIFDYAGQVIGFGGRVMDAQLPKYLNSPETIVFNKSRTLYGIHRARQASRSAGRVFLVEGYFDVLALHLYGIENAVATLGTALTPEHVDLLKGMVGSGKIILVFDGDNAGIQAVRRSIPLFEQKMVEARVITLPKGYDPDLFLRENGPDEFLKTADKAKTMVPFLIETAIEQYGLTIEGRVKIVAELQGILAAVQDSVARLLYVQMLAERLAIDEAAIMEKIRSLGPTVKIASARRGPAEVSMDAGVHRLEERILEMLVRFPEMIEIVEERNLLEGFDDPQLKSIAEKVVMSATGKSRDVADWMNEIEEDRYRNMVAQMAIDDEQWDRVGCERLLAQFESSRERRAAEVLQRRIRDAEKNNDFDLLFKLLRQKQIQAGKGLRTGS